MDKDQLYPRVSRLAEKSPAKHPTGANGTEKRKTTNRQHPQPIPRKRQSNDCIPIPEISLSRRIRGISNSMKK